MSKRLIGTGNVSCIQMSITDMSSPLAVGAVQCHATESHLHGKFGAATELLDNRLDLFDLEPARRRFYFGTRIHDFLKIS
ncbi:hypothetical protein [Burkholderia gladioli]|uniref:hypothetical protein n=1 Tax=Burkholderia gladioli TaxID=28095 RepID=UPI00164160E4|nr:hypothetical protein [Burkholderia gladioli]